MRSARILLLQCRDDEADRRREYDAFLRASGLEEGSLRSVDVTHGGLVGDTLNGITAIIIGGSGWSVFEDMPGLSALRETVVAARSKRIPMFGVCFGAQLLADQFGGEVVRDQEHFELGSFIVRTTDDAWTDMLFADLPEEFVVQEAHRDRVTKLPDGAVLLASSDRCAVQAFVIPSADIYGVQFHPERNKQEFEWGLTNIPQRNYSKDDVTAALADLRDSSASERLLSTFVARMAKAR